MALAYHRGMIVCPPVPTPPRRTAMRSAVPACPAVLCLASAPPARAGQLEDDEAALKEAKIGTDGPTLLHFFRQRVLPEADKQRVRTLIKQLGDDSFRVREKASAALVSLGP